jgi:hypothetical protein
VAATPVPEINNKTMKAKTKAVDFLILIPPSIEKAALYISEYMFYFLSFNLYKIRTFHSLELFTYSNNLNISLNFFKYFFIIELIIEF